MASAGLSQRQAELAASREVSGYGYADDHDNDETVDPVYLQLTDLTCRSYVQYDNAAYDVEEEIGDEEIGLDLSAPPPES